MAQSTRPSASRTQSSSALPSPRNSSEKTEKTEKKPSHHVRRKSGKDYPVAERKRPAILPRRNTPQSTPRVGAVSNSKSKERERCDVEKDNGESFPQFWYVHPSDDPPSWDSRIMTCEKQFIPANNTFLYCSEDCRLHDQAPTYSSPSNSYAVTPNSPPLTPYARASSSLPALFSTEEPRDIVPRLSPTQSRPRSYFNPSPYPSDFSIPYQAPPASLPSSHIHPSGSDAQTSHSSTALASLRGLATGLPRTHQAHEPESPTGSVSRTSSHVWNYIPFASRTTTSTPLATPGNSYTNSSTNYSARRSGEDSYAVGGGMDRPLPPRSGPGGYGHRPRSIDLVTPYSTGIFEKDIIMDMKDADMDMGTDMVMGMEMVMGMDMDGYGYEYGHST
ncbi:life-span regulatory factor domain-containing protein [Rutstroemia sp. NJR-2017a BVV2]|nr:life-span regulatory factor domain-containing protein [Rutstroemia sp. NJR-2017a BVV2]